MSELTLLNTLFLVIQSLFPAIDINTIHIRFINDNFPLFNIII